MTTKQLEAMTRDDLRKLAKERGLSGYSKLRKAELVSLLSEQEQEHLAMTEMTKPDSDAPVAAPAPTIKFVPASTIPAKLVPMSTTPTKIKPRKSERVSKGELRRIRKNLRRSGVKPQVIRQGVLVFNCGKQRIITKSEKGLAVVERV